ncbi:MAG: dTDP-4-dehydrorhamnose reductase [Lewinellaceae bacterium]|nr:dTDP-4-dehydrorhamnose reductase [Saprospiraceae bacterium]MCB9340900.1 dTDP-4-dehydrorhamnose reductase [Lewinellaceae bacterium]
MKKEKPIILVTGSKGQVGQELQLLSPEFPAFDFVFVDIDELDITNLAAVKEFFGQTQFLYCINCAAYTAVDKAESEPNIAWKINAQGVKHLAEACAKQNASLLQISTDYVYHNAQNWPYKETDITNPQGIYAKTKLEGDKLALETNPGRTAIIRTSWVYSSFGHNFVKTMLKLGPERGELKVVYDQIGSPTYARDLAGAMLTILQKIETGQVAKEKLNGIFHYSNEGVTSWFDFAVAIFEMNQMDVKVAPIETKDFPSPAKRPHYSLLNKAKIKTTFGLEIPHWQQALKACLARL